MSLRDAWEANAREFAVWAREPGHDSYWRFHREQFFALLPPPGRLTLDIACGEGRVSRDLAALGHTVVGVDASPTMVALAREADPSITVHLADAADLPLDDGCADLAVLFMSLQDIDDMPGAIREVSRVLAPGGRMCTAIVHPINSAGRFESEDPDSPFIIAGSYLASRRSAETFERGGLRVTFHSEHRPLEAYFAALEAAGLAVEALREPAVPEHGFRTPRGKRWQRLPLFLHLRARKGLGSSRG